MRAFNKKRKPKHRTKFRYDMEYMEFWNHSYGKSHNGKANGVVIKPWGKDCYVKIERFTGHYGHKINI